MVRGSMPLLIVGVLDLTPALRLAYGYAHRVRLFVSVHDDPPVDVAGGAADGLDQRSLTAQEAFLVRVEDGDERYLGEVEAFAEEVDADEHVELSRTQAADDLDAVQRLYVGVHVARLDVVLEQVVREVLGHLYGKGRDEYTLAVLDALGDLVEEVVDLVLVGRTSTSGSTRPVGRMICSTICPEFSSS